MNINVRQELIFALGLNDYLKPMIDDMYENNKWDYYEASKPFREDIVIKTFSAKKEEMILKIAGIVNYSYENEDNKESIISLIKKGYKTVFRYARDTEELSLAGFAEIFNKKHKTMESSEIVIFNNYFLLIYLARYFEKELLMDKKFSNLLTMHIVSRHEIAGYRIDSIRKEKNNEFYQENKVIIDSAKKTILSKTNSIGGNIDVMLSNFVESEVRKRIATIYGIKYDKDIPYEIYQRERSNVFSSGISKYIGAYSGLVSTMGLNPNYLTTETEFSKLKFQELLVNTMKFTIGNNLTDSEMEMFFISSLFIYNLTDLYKDTKESYLGDAQETLYLENKNNQILLQQEKKKLLKEKESMEHEREVFTDRENIYKDTVQELDREILQLRKQLQLKEDHDKELIALRNYAYKPTEDDYRVDVISLDEKIEVLKEINAVVFGGHPKFIQKLKEKLPNFEYRETDSLNRNLDFVKNKDVVFLQTCFFNHPFYYKIMSEIKKNDRVKLSYLSGYDNMELTINEMYQIIKK